MAYTPTSPSDPSLGEVQFPFQSNPTFDTSHQGSSDLIKPSPAQQATQLGVRPPSPTPSHHSASDNQYPHDPTSDSDVRPHRSIPSHLALPYIAKRNSSVSSLMDAVVGSTSTSNSYNSNMNNNTSANTNSNGNVSSAPQLRTPLTPISPFALRDVSGSGAVSFGSAGQAQAQGDANFIKGASGQAKTGSGPNGVKQDGQKDEAVKELQEKVDKRRSQLPQLESQLAALEAQIKAAEERLARVQSGN